jgi:hypothetical protein
MGRVQGILAFSRMNGVMRFSVILIIFLGLSVGQVAAGSDQEIELNDGSVIFGEIVTLEEDVYTIRSVDLGMVLIERSKIRAIRSRSNTETTGKQLKAIEQRMMKNDEILTLLLALESDPAFKEIMDDPEIMKKVSSGDLHGLMSNPKFMKLLDNPTVQEIKSKLEE